MLDNKTIVDNTFIVNYLSNKFIVKLEDVMNINTGVPARGPNFYYRKNIIQKAWDLIESGNHILIAAPRRVGKTSVMYYLKDNPKDGYDFLFLDTESVNNENEFFRRVVNKVLKLNTVKSSQKILTFIKEHTPSVSKIGKDGVEFGVKDDLNYFEVLLNILSSFGSDQNKLIIMLDEFPQTLENIIADESKAAGIRFLHSNRELRQDEHINQHVQFIYTGSIGLENIVETLDASKSINDLSRLSILPLRPNEAKDLIDALLKNLQFDLPDDLVTYILEKIKWLIPFYIQLVIEGVRDLYRDENLTGITTSVIDKVFENMLEHRNHFEHWHSRLRTTCKGNAYNFSKEVLNIISENEIIQHPEVYDIAVKYNVQDTCKGLIGALIYDGYINNDEDPKIYQFNSPILKMWWRQNVAN